MINRGGWAGTGDLWTVQMEFQGRLPVRAVGDGSVSYEKSECTGRIQTCEKNIG